MKIVRSLVFFSAVVAAVEESSIWQSAEVELDEAKCPASGEGRRIPYCVWRGLELGSQLTLMMYFAAGGLQFIGPDMSHRVNNNANSPNVETMYDVMVQGGWCNGCTWPGVCSSDGPTGRYHIYIAKQYKRVEPDSRVPQTGD